MSCEKYSGWMTDAALGELAAERQPELLAHAMECEACREALGHATKVREFVERGVATLMAGEPSAEFETRLRRRIRQEPRVVEFYWTAWAPIAAGALALAGFLIFAALHPARQGAIGPSVASSATDSLPSMPSSNAAAKSVKNAVSAQAAASVRASEGIRHGPRANTNLPKIIVPEGQLVAAARLSEAINSGRVDGARLLAAQQEYEKPLEVKPIEIAPLALDSPASADDDAEKPVAPIQF